jgi:PAS domain-containing protein
VESGGLEHALAATNTGITIADATPDGLPLTYVNAAFEALTGYRAQEILGRNCRFLQGPETDPAAVPRVHAALEERREIRVVLTVVAVGDVIGHGRRRRAGPHSCAPPCRPSRVSRTTRSGCRSWRTTR